MPLSRAVVVELFAVTMDSRRRIFGFMFAMVDEAHDVMIYSTLIWLSRSMPRVSTARSLRTLSLRRGY